MMPRRHQCARNNVLDRAPASAHTRATEKNPMETR
jgi:hypothetical protein